MKLITVCLLWAILLAVTFDNAHAQVALSSIQGKVLTDARVPAESATIILLKARDSSIVSSTIIGKNGRYRFDDVPADSYLLLATMIGFNRVYAGPYELEEDKTFRVSEIVLKPSSNQLKEVTISSTRPEIEVRPGKITINIPNSLTAEGSSVLEILRQSPGVRVDNSNNINIIGRQNALVTIDGKATSLTGDDLATYLRSLQSSAIDRIELITAGSAKYDASSGGIVNIVLKKGTNVGANGSITATAGYGKYYKSNIGIAFNDRMDKFNVFGSYNFTADKTFRNIMTNRFINFDGVLSNYDVNYRNVQQSTNSGFNLGADVFISPKHTIGFLINGMSRHDDFTKNNGLNISNQGSLDSIITANSALSRHVTKINYNINYSGKLDKAGTTLMADLNYTTFNRSSSEYITNQFYKADWSPYRADLLLENLSPSTIHIWLSKLDFSTPLSKTSTLETGVKNSHVSSNNDLIFGPKVGNEYIPNPNLSNHFYYTENINVAYLNYQNKFNKVDLTIGVRGEQTTSNGNSVTMNSKISRDYFSVFPQTLVTYHINDKNELSLSYNRGIGRPAYEEINPFLYYIDLYDYRSGNPNLKPEYSNNIELSHTYKKIITTSLYATIISDAYDFGFYEQNDTSKVSILTHTNFGRIYNYGIRFSAPVAVNAWWNAYFHIDASYQRYVAYPQNGNLNKGTQDVIFNTIQSFKLGAGVNASITGVYESPNFYGINQNKAQYRVDAGLGTQLFNKRGTLRLNVLDVFNTQRDRAQTNYQNLNQTIVDKKESQVARLTFSYRFGKTTVKAAADHRTGNEEEQKRIGNGGGN
ncbi:TonB-dependent receptor [Mucilaginibacter flavidus]|uniref:TonB-dependent receptor n=1 Tax=Mucilaginibacter flavidus TaxID=2949309 RepID=UPI002093A045|nr:TonB-dependent receptor [Mucilaginibacter flavidus]MCO5951030.1 TonB-dependent receptor [Mucilaginibacter flavidus]